MKSKKIIDGIAVYYSKKKYAIGNENGKMITEFDLSDKQVECILRFLEEGVFDEMLKVVPVQTYIDALNAKYETLKEGAKSSEEEMELQQECYEKMKALVTFTQEKSKSLFSQAQPE